MYYEVYIDVVFLMNLTLDFIIIKITGGIAKRKSTLLRSIFAAVLSSSVLCLVCICNTWILVEYYFILMFIMNLTTVFAVFYRKKTKIYEIIYLTVIYYLVSFILGGIINLIYANTAVGYYLFTVPWWGVCLISIICLMIIKPIMLYIEKQREHKSIYYVVEIFLGSRMVRINGLLDTGNHLIEPVSGKMVHVSELSVTEELFSEKFVAAVREYYKKGTVGEGLYLENGIRMVPFRAVGTPESRLLVAVPVAYMKVKGENVEREDKDVYIALYDGKLAGDGSYRILLNSKEMIKERS